MHLSSLGSIPLINCHVRFKVIRINMPWVFLVFTFLILFWTAKKTVHNPSIQCGWCYTLLYCWALSWGYIQRWGNSEQNVIHQVDDKEENFTSNSTLQMILEHSLCLPFDKFNASPLSQSILFHQNTLFQKLAGMAIAPTLYKWDREITMAP